MQIISKHKPWAIALVSAAALIGGSGMAHATSIVYNGSFETSNPANLSVGTFTTLNNGSTSIDGWTVGDNGVDYIGTYWNASDGARSLDLNAFDVGSVSQGLNTVVGQKYHVSFDISGNPDANSAAIDARTGQVFAGVGSDVFSFVISAHPGLSKTNMQWETHGFDFIASSTLTTLTFKSTTTGDSGNGTYPTAFGPALDNVSVVAVPLPATALAGGSLLSLIAAFRLIRRRDTEI